mmetsp:Transcript_18046/g.13076  ORF Transcript_18046/g.13076 Transcript_18046/m.13076 type:complete len:151 (+) Transcript_18046:1110-1562(+)
MSFSLGQLNPESGLIFAEGRDYSILQDYAELVIYIGPYGFDDFKIEGLDNAFNFAGTQITFDNMQLKTSCWSSSKSNSGGVDVGGGDNNGGNNEPKVEYVTEGWQDKVKRASSGFGIILVLLIALFLASAAGWVVLSKKKDKVELQKDEL